MIKLVVGIVGLLSIGLYGASAVASDICTLNEYYYSTTWSGIITLAGTFGFMMVLIDKYALSSLSTSTTPEHKLKFRYNIWLPLSKFSLLTLAICLIYQTIEARTIEGTLFAGAIALFVFNLVWTTSCKPLTNPLVEIAFTEENSSHNIEVHLRQLFKKHVAIYGSLYGLCALSFYIIHQLLESNSCSIALV